MVNNVCAVSGCGKESYPSCGLSFHSLPSDLELKKKWLEVIPGNLHQRSVVCSVHFKPEDYRTEGRKRLKPGVTPIFPMVNMQRILSLSKTIFSSIPKQAHNITANFSMFKNITAEKLLPVQVPLINTVCNFKVKGKVRRRCKSCYFVMRQERLYVICPEHPRHKQMARKPKPHNTWILTHASQSKIRPW